ncbi:MAG TPA: type II toxin-antitoxin system YhaV family toxin [Bryobacteraceae bacterium]
MAVSYTVELTKTAEKVYERLFNDAQACLAAGDVSNSKVTLFNMIEEALDKIIPYDPFAPERSLSGSLSGAFRVKKGRFRICYAGSSDQKRIVVLYISDSPRKAGDTNDPYAIFTKLVTSGKFDDVFRKLGVRRPV